MIKLDIAKLEPELQQGLSVLEKYNFVQVRENGIEVKAEYGEALKVQKREDALMITYDTKPHFYMTLARGIGMENGEQIIKPKAKELGFMLDCSRNAVPTVETVKRLICLLAMIGYTYLELYTEETYELPDEPYFGYKRGRYSETELREIVAFSKIFGVQMVPCIQTLAHLKNLANWRPYYDHMDIDDILMVGDERTYALIRKMLTYCKNVFETSRIHVGMDEAFHLGRGRYTDTNGYRSKHEVYLEHLRCVFAICKELGMQPDFWADGFYETDLPIEDIKEIFDGSQLPIYWEYSIEEKEPHAQKMHQLKGYAGRVGYAGATWRCLGYAPNNALSDRVANVAFEAAFECGVEDILMTAWGDDGGECSFYTLLPSMWHAANLVYPMESNKEIIMEALTGYTDEEWRMCDKMNYVMPNATKLCNSVKCLLHNDFLIGLMDANIPDHAGKVYQELLPRFEELAQKDNRFSYLFKTYAAACKVLIKKATYSKRLYKAYQEKDKDAIRHMVAELEPIKEGLHQFYNTYRIQWLKENKGFGFEVLDVRIGGLISRVDTVVYVLEEYLAGRMERIYELEEGRIEYFCGRLEGDDVYWTESELTRKVPVKAGFVFGGWYVTENETREPLTEANLKDGGIEAYTDTAYAKFVPAEVLSIKTQVGTPTSEGNTITSMRILSTVDSTKYQAVGFEYKLAANALGTTPNITKVYSAIRPYKGAPDSVTQEPGETFVDGVSQYFIAADVSSISAESEAKIVYARPFWITLDGTKVMGLARNNRVEDKDPDKDLAEHYTSVGINLLTDGKAVAAVAAGKIQVTYNTDNYDVVGTPDITTDATNGGTYLFEEMECHVDEDAGTITFVGNAEIVKANSIADGLFANIRFEKAANNTGDALDFTVETDVTEFCDWSETDVTQQVVVQ